MVDQFSPFVCGVCFCSISNADRCLSRLAVSILNAKNNTLPWQVFVCVSVGASVAMHTFIQSRVLPVRFFDLNEILPSDVDRIPIMTPVIKDSILLFWLFVSVCISFVASVKSIYTYGHQMTPTANSPSSSSSTKNGKGSKHDPIDIESIPEKNSHKGQGSKTNPIHISDLGERTRPIEVSDSQTSKSGNSPQRQQNHQLHSSHTASKKRPNSKSIVISHPSTSAPKRGRKRKNEGSGSQLIDQWLNFIPPSPPKNN